ncbi:MAG TPA: ABC transporter ATP-binding protein [Pseudolabrys sp.]|nr:ABC transporter ATP-binding protein [Pseudolabrys sp.]
MAAVRASRISKSYGAFVALKDVDLLVAPGERRAIIGPNGAGKTTLFSIIAGQKQPTSGTISINGSETTGARPDQLWARGLSRTFQRNQLFQNLTVWENVELACSAHYRGFSTSVSRDELEEEIGGILERVNLLGSHDVRVANMAYGGQRQLELALALAGRPKILLLDEPTAGMSPAETQAMLKMMIALPRDMTILIVEHDMDVVFSLADRVMVLNLGEVLADGTVQEIQNDKNVSEIYMGKAL